MLLGNDKIVIPVPTCKASNFPVILFIGLLYLMCRFAEFGLEKIFMNIPEQLIREFHLRPVQVRNTLALFDDGATVPFIARYRKEMTGGLDEIQIRDLMHRNEYYNELDERRTTILDSIREQGKLTPELETKIVNTFLKTELEDLYLPYKPRRMTRAIKAKEAGLEALAQWLVDCSESACDVSGKATSFVNVEKGFDFPQKALQGAMDILAEQLSDNAEIRKHLREIAAVDGAMTSSVKKEFKEQKTKFEMYYDFHEKISTMPSHRILALFRGEREKVLRVSLDMPVEKVTAYLESKLIKYPGSATVVHLQTVVKDSFERLLLPATETEVRIELREKADAIAFKVFGENLEALLLAAPAGRKAVLGVDPGFRTGCKVVAVDETGKLLEYRTIFPHEPQKKVAEASKDIAEMISKHNVVLVAIGNGTAGRETMDFISETIETIPAEKRPVSVIVNESGASVYSASEVAQKEFPDFDLTIRGAISIARRLQDPLAELVKIDPKAIGVGQYQHDVNQGKLKLALEEVVESCVNRVGVDINLASEELCKYVSGLNRLMAGRIIRYRNENGAFASRNDLKKIPGIGEKTFQQAAGFLRISGGTDPLDNSAVHPERYGLVERMALTLGTTVGRLIGNSTLLRAIDKKQFVSEKIGLPTIEDILAELEKPGRDPRASFTYAHFDRDIRSIADLREGMLLEGTVTNVTNFGAFVDIGVHQDGLVHISEMSDSFVTDPKQVVKVGQIVRVRVIKIDPVLQRISISMKKTLSKEQIMR
jgi:Transcriptional accessory protein